MKKMLVYAVAFVGFGLISVGAYCLGYYGSMGVVEIAEKIAEKLGVEL